jgi:hypothetical protein
LPKFIYYFASDNTSIGTVAAPVMAYLLKYALAGVETDPRYDLFLELEMKLVKMELNLK